MTPRSNSASSGLFHAREFTCGRTHNSHFRHSDNGVKPSQKHSQCADRHHEFDQEFREMLPERQVSECKACCRPGVLNSNAAHQQPQLLIRRLDLLHEQIKEGIEHDTRETEVLLELDNE